VGERTRVLALATSPRLGGNSETLLDRFLEGARSGGAEAEKVHIAGLNIGPCIECNGCFERGCCVVEDAFQGIAGKVTETDRIVIAMPVYFMAPCAQAKALIDRCQSFWARKYVVKAPLREGPPVKGRRGAWIAVGGTRGSKLFAGMELTMKYWFDAIYISEYSSVKAWGADAKGEILKQEEVLEEAYEKGAELARV